MGECTFGRQYQEGLRNDILASVTYFLLLIPRRPYRAINLVQRLSFLALFSLAFVLVVSIGPGVMSEAIAGQW